MSRHDEPSKAPHVTPDCEQSRKLPSLRPEEGLSRPPTHLRVIATHESIAEPTLDADTLFVQYSRYVASIAYRIMGRREDADDVVQDVFLHAHQNLHRVRQPEAVRGWLATAAVRIARRRLQRRRFLRLVYLDASPDYLNVASASTLPEERAQVAALYRLLDTVPPGQRTAWVLRRIEGMTLAETAAVSGCSVATAKRWIAAVDETVQEHSIRGESDA